MLSQKQTKPNSFPIKINKKELSVLKILCDWSSKGLFMYSSDIYFLSAFIYWTLNVTLFLLFCFFFSRFLNQYFLLIACLQLWSLITPVNPASTWGPLIFIFAVSASKEAWDDYNRYLSDKKANEKEVWVVKHGIRKHVWKPLIIFSCNSYSSCLILDFDTQFTYICSQSLRLSNSCFLCSSKCFVILAFIGRI